MGGGSNEGLLNHLWGPLNFLVSEVIVPGNAAFPGQRKAVRRFGLRLCLTK